jgi:segregation and condensation protein B
MEQKNLVEAALFMTPRPLKEQDISKITRIGSLGTIKELLEQLEKDYESRGVRVLRTSEGWEMQVAPHLLPNVAKLAPYSNLSEGCKRALALVVYHEPMPQAELIRIQGNKAYAYVKRLEKMGLIRTQKEGRTKKLHLTSEFEAYFGEQKDKIKQQLEEQYAKRKAKDEKREARRRESGQASDGTPVTAPDVLG